MRSLFQGLRLRPARRSELAAVLAVVIAALFAAFFGAAAQAQPATPTLAELQQLAAQHAPSTQLAEQDARIAELQADATRARHGARLVAGGSMASAREAVTETLARDYQRSSLQLGVRWPLLGSREAQQRVQRDADGAAASARLRAEQARAQAVAAVREAWVRWRRSAQRERLAEGFLAARPQIAAQLQQRVARGYMLAPEMLDLDALFAAVQRLRDNERVAQQGWLRALARHSGRAIAPPPQGADALAPPRWADGCVREAALLAQLDDMPAVAQARAELNIAQARLQGLRYEGIEAGVSLLQGVTQDWGGQAGRATTLGIDLQMPLDWRAERDALRGAASAARERAALLVEQRRDELRDEITTAAARLALRNGEMAAHRERQRAAQEGVRVMRLRLPAFDGDGYSKLLMARHALYAAALQIIDGEERRELAELELVAHGGECTPLAASADDDPAQPLLRDSIELLAAAAAAAVHGANGANGAHGPNRVASDTAPPASRAATAAVVAAGAGDAATSAAAAPALGWFVWDGAALLRRAELPPQLRQAQRLLLSFDGRQLRELADAKARAAVAARLQRVRAQGVRVELLLGDPGWVRPAGRAALLALLAPLRELPFDALNLDLERSQLPAAEQPQWDDGLIDTLQAVRTSVPWPLALTTHYRELQDAALVARIRDAGVQEVVAMAYIANVDAAATRLAPLLEAVSTAPAGLRIAIAQSIEPTLGADESHHRAGRRAARLRWAQLAQRLQAAPAFAGIVVQSWEHFSRTKE